MTRGEFYSCLFTEVIFYQVYHIHQFNRIVIAEVKYFVTSRLETHQCPASNIINIRKISLLFAVSKNRYRDTFIDVFYKDKNTHIRPSSRTVDREISWYAYIKTKKIMVAVAKDLSSLFCR